MRVFLAVLLSLLGVLPASTRSESAAAARAPEVTAGHIKGTARANGIEIAYESHGRHDAETMLLVQGLGAQLTQWPSELIVELVARDYRVIVFDNRDVGLSTKLRAAGPPNWPAVFAALAPNGPPPPPLAYTLDDMAEDSVGLMDALGIRAAHIVGASMGGQIAQLIAIRHPDRVLSLTSMMTDTGNPKRELPTAEFMSRLPAAPPASASLEVVQAHAVAVAKALAGPAYPPDENRVRALAAIDYRRAHYPDGGARQFAAGLLAADRREGLRRLAAPTVVLHGGSDPLVMVSNAREQAEVIPHAELVIIPGMGHEQPPAAAKLFADAIVAAAVRAKRFRRAHLAKTAIALEPIALHAHDPSDLRLVGKG